MYLDFLVSVPDVPGKIVRKRIKETVYIDYEYDRSYDAVRKFNIPKRATIGKQSSENASLMHPNQNYLRYFPETVRPQEKAGFERSSCLRIGSYLVIRKVIEDYRLQEMIGRIFGKDGGVLLDLAAYSIVCENNAGQYYPDYAFNHPLLTEGMRVYSDSKVSSFLSSITEDHTSSFLNGWNYKRNHRERVYISYDSTNKNCQAGDISIVEYGHPKDDKGLPVFNYAIAYGRTNCEPLFYEEYPGSIVDVSHLQFMLEKAKAYGYRNVGFILDRGCFSKGNIDYMDDCGYDFVIMFKGMASLVGGLITEHKGTFESSRECSIRSHKVYAKTVRARLYASDKKDRYFHLYYSSAKDSAEKEEVETRMDRMAKLIASHEMKRMTFPKAFQDYFDLVYDKKRDLFLFGKEKSDVVERALGLCGYFVIVTSERMSAKEALDLYKARDQSEKLFKGDKSYLGDKSAGIYSDESVSGKIFIEFVALIIRNRMYCQLKDGMEEYVAKPNYMTVPAAIKELEKVEMIRQMDGIYRLDHAVTTRQKNVLKAFGLDADHVREKAIDLGRTLASMKPNMTKKSDQDGTHEIHEND
ncbi:MAG: transposase [Sphaerochaeta sp.]|nr:transposase [Sphaerochaeta sp.]